MIAYIAVCVLLAVIAVFVIAGSIDALRPWQWPWLFDWPRRAKGSRRARD